MNEKIYLFTKADDLGSSTSANRAFYDCYKNGILKNGVIMMPCSYAKEAAELFRGQKDFCMGLHLTLTAEWDSIKWGPVLPPEKVPSLVKEDGAFFGTTQGLKNNKPRVQEILSEFDAQLELARIYGLDIKFADCHMGIEVVADGLSEKIEEWCRKNDLFYGFGDFKELPLGSYDGEPEEKLLQSLKSAQSGTYFLYGGHPAYDTVEMRGLGHEGYPGDVVAREREQDRRMLMGQEVVDYCVHEGVVPVTLLEALKSFNPMSSSQDK